MRLVIMLLIVELLGAAFAYADVVELKDGSIYKGEIVSLTDKSVEIDTKQGRIKIDKEHVKAANVNQDTVAENAKELKDAKPLQVNAPAPTKGKGVPEDAVLLKVDTKETSDTIEDIYYLNGTEIARRIFSEDEKLLSAEGVDDCEGALSSNCLYITDAGRAYYVPGTKIRSDEEWESARRGEMQFLLGILLPGQKVKLYAEDDLGSTGGTVGARFLTHISPGVSFGVEIQSLRSGEKNSVLLVPNAITSSKYKSQVFLGEIKIMAQSKTVQPFLLMGLGGHSTSINIQSSPMAGFYWINTGTRETRVVVDSSATGFAATAQAGLDVLVSKSVSFGVSAVWYYFGDATYDATPIAQQTVPGFLGVKGAISSAVLMGNITYRF